MVEWAQMKLVAGAAMGSLILLGWIVGAGGHTARLGGGPRMMVAGESRSGRLVANPVVQLPRLSRSVFAPVRPCQIAVSCVD